MQRRNVIILMISLSLVLLLGSSYALLRSREVGSTPYVINVGSLQVTFEDNQTEALTLENMYPMSDKEGSSQSKELGFTVKNTGNIEARYNVYLEETSTNPEFKNHIRFISNKNNQGYNEPKTMGYDKYIDLEARLGVSENTSASYKVKVWLDYDAGNEYMNETFTAKVVVESSQVDTSNTLYTKINNEIAKHSGTTIVEDGITYLSGSNDDVNYNYVWYSGKLWRITSINSDGTIKMITEDGVTSIYWGETTNYKTSWVRQFLNEDFKDSLYNYENLLVADASWNATEDGGDIPSKPTTLKNQVVVNDYVGMISAYEYYLSYNKSNVDNHFLRKSSCMWLITPFNDENIRDVTDSLFVNRPSNTYGRGIRPMIVLKSQIEISLGNGSKEKPYQLKGDIEKVKINDKLNTRVSGEYVDFNDETYKIVSINNKETKLVKNDYLRDGSKNIITKKLSKTSYYGSGTDDSYWDYYLNNTWYNNLKNPWKSMLVSDTYYLGTIYMSSYKNGICKESNTKFTTKECEKTLDIWNGYIGSLRVGELFSIQPSNNTDIVWMISRYYSERNWDLAPFNNLDVNYSTQEYAILPTITISRNVIITSGDGMTPSTAFEITLPENL